MVTSPIYYTSYILEYLVFINLNAERGRLSRYKYIKECEMIDNDESPFGSISSPNNALKFHKRKLTARFFNPITAHIHFDDP